MCGIIGYTGPLEARDLLLNGLAGLEYRGYDSAGIAYFNTDSQVRIIKNVGKVAALRECVCLLYTSCCEIMFGNAWPAWNAARLSADSVCRIGLNTAPTTEPPFTPKNQKKCRNI